MLNNCKDKGKNQKGDTWSLPYRRGVYETHVGRGSMRGKHDRCHVAGWWHPAKIECVEAGFNDSCLTSNKMQK